MRSVTVADGPARLRARRWDVVILGSGLPGWIAAVRLAMGRRRVLVVEEEAAARLPIAAREPFFLAGAGPGGVLDQCLRALALPLIDRRRLLPDPVAYQVILPEARVDVGEPGRWSEELVSWGLAKPEPAQALARELAEAAAAERAALLEAPFVRAGGLRELARGVTRSRAPRHARGLPAELVEPPAALAPWVDAQIRALIQTATPSASPEARARLLGAALEGAASFATVEDSLLGLLRRRFQALHGEIRLLPGAFELVGLEGQPGIAPARSGEVWLGRALVLNAPPTRLLQFLEDCGAEKPDFLEPAPRLRSRAWVALRARREVVPEAMARRLVVVRDPSRPCDGDNAIRIGLFPERDGRHVDVMASFVLPEGEVAKPEDVELAADTVRELMPFAGGRLRPAAVAALPRWDDELVVADPLPGAGWPDEAHLRLLARPPVYQLPREDVGVLGFEGDCLLGWRAGEALLAELS